MKYKVLASLNFDFGCSWKNSENTASTQVARETRAVDLADRSDSWRVACLSLNEAGIPHKYFQRPQEVSKDRPPRMEQLKRSVRSPQFQMPHFKCKFPLGTSVVFQDNKIVVRVTTDTFIPYTDH